MSDVKVTIGDAGEVLQFGPTRVRILEDGSGTENRISAITSMMAPHTDGPPSHVHLMHDEAFLVTSGVLRFMMGDVQRDAKAGDYVVVPPGAPHTFVNASDEPVSFLTTFTPAFYISSFRELAQLNATGRLNAQTLAEVLTRYATVTCD
ncbi:cupin domain-containing protein [Novosphingopyxis sp.]|uniref:cupin domain-containing protein n=1 Tax=Novosphingopyxis sp. TaxID=2709690 RepID=UPI003B5A519D